MLPGWVGVRGMGDILATDGYTVPDRVMRAPVSVDYQATLGDIMATQGFTVPDRVMNPVADYVSGNRAMPGGCAGCSCKGGAAGASLNGLRGIGDLAADFAAIQSDFTAGNYTNILSAPIMGIPYAIPLAIAAVMILPGMFSGGGRRRR